MRRQSFKRGSEKEGKTKREAVGGFKKEREN